MKEVKEMEEIFDKLNLKPNEIFLLNDSNLYYKITNDLKLKFAFKPWGVYYGAKNINIQNTILDQNQRIIKYLTTISYED